MAALVIAAGVGTGLGVTVSGRSQTGHRLITIGPHDPLIAATEAQRRPAGAPIESVTLTAAPTTIHLDGRAVNTWAFNGTVPGPQIRVRAGQVLRATVINRLPAPLTIHWHGIALRNDMDGVPGLTQPAIQPGRQYTYQFTVSDPGTFFYHSHVGTQLDTGLYGPLIVDPSTGRPSQPDLTLMLDDWIDGTGTTPDQVLAQLKSMGGMRMGGMGGMTSNATPPSTSSSGMSAMSDMSNMGNSSPTSSGMSDLPGMTGTASSNSPLGADTGDVRYPYYLINGRPGTDPATYSVTPGGTVRLRIVNAGSDTAFRVAFAGAPMTVVATDGNPVEAVTVDTLIIGMGERYDVDVTVPGSGVYPLVAAAEGKDAQALAVLRSGPGPAPAPDVVVPALAGRLLILSDLHATPADALSARTPDVTYRLALTGNMMTYRWGIDAPKQGGATLAVRVGQRVRLVLENDTSMWHPIHLHGHSFQVVTGSTPGPVKDTVIVAPMTTVTIDVQANNPGQWLLHCHNIYHAEAGMITTLSYVK